MKLKTVSGIMVTMLLVTSALSVLPVGATPDVLKIGVIGPVGWMQGAGMYEGAVLARDWINDDLGGGGIVIDGTRYDVEVYYRDEHAADMRPDLGAAEMRNLIEVDGVDLIFGGFRSESVFAMREVAMDYKKLYFISGAATDQLIDCGVAGCPVQAGISCNPDPMVGCPAEPGGSCDTACVRCDYDRYKYLFRVTPINDTMLMYNIMSFMKGYVFPYRLEPLYGDPDPGTDVMVKTAVIAEDLDWTVSPYQAFVYKTLTYLGPHADIVYSARTAWDETDFSPYLSAMAAEEVRLVIPIFSAPASMAFIAQMAASGLKAVVAGIDVLGQGSYYWDLTAGKCEYEAFLSATGTRTPVTDASQPWTTVEVWDNYYSAFGHVPIYTSWALFDGLISMHDLLENVTGQLTSWIHPPFDQADTDALIPLLEATDRQGPLARVKYTQYHDPFSNEYGSTWTQGYVRANWVQWQAGRLEVVFPMDQAYSKKWILPNQEGSMYPYPEDVNQDGTIDTDDISDVGYAFGSYPVAMNEPAHPRWQFAADVDGDGDVDGDDAPLVGMVFGRDVVTPGNPLPYCDESGRLD